jgi:hypothetical protein
LAGRFAAASDGAATIRQRVAVTMELTDFFVRRIAC